MYKEEKLIKAAVKTNLKIVTHASYSHHLNDILKKTLNKLYLLKKFK